MRRQQNKTSGCNCPYCDQPLSDDQTICQPCSAQITRCPECHQPLPRNASVCPNCGKKIKPK
ncbi:MAG: double zinc ribbon domain-containing protein [candidate division WOR-3 bacterium]